VSKLTGFLQLRRGVFEHVRDGRLSHRDAVAFIYIVAQADTRTGVWKGSANALAGEMGMSPRTARGVLERLSARGYLKRFPVPGKHSCYPILVHKFLITDGQHKGEQLNAIESTSYLDLAYFSSGRNGEHHVERGAAQKRIENREQRRNKNHAAKTAPPADPRFQPFFQFAHESFALKHRRKPLWQGKDRNGLKNLLRSQGAAALPLERLQSVWRNFLDSTEAFTVKQGDSLAYFCSNIDKFSDGPILAAPGKGINGKPTATDLAIQNARALGLAGKVN